MKPTSRSEVLQLYRSLLREAHKQPDPLVKLTYSVYIRDRFRRNKRIPDEALRYQKIKTAKQKLKQLQAANAQDKAAVARTLRFVYGASGPLRHFNLTSYKHSNNPPSLNEARPPPFPPALRALLASPLARVKSSMRTQPDEPTDLLLALDKRGWLGKLPERREKSIWWKWWREEPTRTLVPTEIQVTDINTSTISTSPDETGASVRKNSSSNGFGVKVPSTSLRLRQLGLPITRTQDSRLVHRAEAYAKSRITPKPPRLSAERNSGTSSQANEATPSTIPPQSRFIRRRYRDLLSKMPILIFKPTSSSSPVMAHSETRPAVSLPAVAPGKFDVSISPFAATPGSRNRTTYSIMRQEDREWVERAQQAKPLTKHKTQTKTPTGDA